MLWTVRVGDRATTVAKDGTAVYTFDLEGRPVSWWEAERTYKRSLASEVHETRRINGRTIRTLIWPCYKAEFSYPFCGMAICHEIYYAKDLLHICDCAK